MSKVDYLAENYNLHYLTTKEKHEVDFAFSKDDIIEQIIEVKYRDDKVSHGLRFFQKKYDFHATQVVKELKRERVDDRVEVVRAERFLQGLFL